VTSSATAIRASVLWSAPSSLGRLSRSLIPRAEIHTTVKTKNPVHAASIHPRPDQKPVGRRPKSRARGRAVRRAKNSALPIRERSWITVATMLTQGGSLSALAPPAAAMAPSTM
jgi:hypothetical protein